MGDVTCVIKSGVMGDVTCVIKCSVMGDDIFQTKFKLLLYMVWISFISPSSKWR